MREIPDIRASSPAVIVDAITERRSVLRFFGERIWIVRWRSVQNPGVRGISVLNREMRVGTASLGADRFSFVVRWRGDLRRRTLRVRHPSDNKRRAVHNDMVTPLSVVQLSELTSTD
jgi:hypothetical protein